MSIPSIILSPALFLAGVALLIFSVEELIENVTKAAVLTGVSSFMLAVLFAGMDFENWAFGVASVLGDLSGIAIGSAIGSAVFLVGVAVAVGGLSVPFEVKADKDYLLLTLISPVLLLPFLLGGGLTRVDGAVLLLIFGAMIYYLYREESKGRETFRDEEAREAVEEVEEGGHGKWFYLGLSALFVLGIVLGSEMAVRGARGVVDLLGFGETVFGMTFVGLVMSLEEVLLVVEPVRKGRESIAIGNILGSLIFFSTGNVGLIALTRGFPIDPAVLGFYWPFLFASAGLIALFLWRGRIKRPEGVVLGGMYVLYWVLSYSIL